MKVLIRLGVSPSFRTYHGVIAAIQMAIECRQVAGQCIRVVPSSSRVAKLLKPFLDQLDRTPNAWGVDVPTRIDGVHTFDLVWNERAGYLDDGAWACVRLEPHLGG